MSNSPASKSDDEIVLDALKKLGDVEHLVNEHDPNYFPPRSEGEAKESRLIDAVMRHLPKAGPAYLESHEALADLIVHFHREIRHLKALMLALANIDQPKEGGPTT